MEKITFDSNIISKQKVAINTSTSKQMFTFPKASRFKHLKLTSDVFYNLPSTKSKRSTSLGYGTKSDFTKYLKKGKTDNYYNIPSQFDYKKKLSLQYSMGKGRDICKTSYDLIKKNIPGPGAYNPKHIGKRLGVDSSKFSLFGRSWNKPFKKSTEPGPGDYRYMSINKLGRYPSSKYCNSTSSIFSKFTKKRFLYSNLNNPAPNAYFKDSKLSLMNGTGYNFSSKYLNCIGKTMGAKLHKRNISLKESYPGPGYYETFSEFSGYSLPLYCLNNKKFKLKKKYNNNNKKSFSNYNNSLSKSISRLSTKTNNRYVAI